MGQGIAGLVAQTGRFVNIKDAYKHPQFFSEVDKSTGFHTHNMLCFPIKDHQGLVVGVAELCNKIGGELGGWAWLGSELGMGMVDVGVLQVKSFHCLF